MLRFSLILAAALLSGTAFAQAAHSPEQLVINYKTALAKGDKASFAAMLAVAAERDRQPVTEQFVRRSRMKLVSAEIVAFATYESAFKAAVARGAKPSVEPKAWLVVKYAPQAVGDGGTLTETDVFLVGLKDGKYMLSS